MASSSKSPFLDLPLETQKHVFTYLSHKDLLSSLTVSPHFFSLASAQLYRVVDFKLTNSDVGDDAGSSMRTAEALQTIVASDYNYGQYIKSFSMTMVEDNNQSTAVMSRFLWDKSNFASKILNTSLLLLIKKSTMLESFLWDVPIDLSGAVYQALHKIQSLRQLRLRLDVSLSLKLNVHPGSLPSSSGISNHPSSSSAASLWPGMPPISSSSSQFGSMPPPKLRAVKKKKAGQRTFWTGNRELSGFKHLHSLSLLGISSLDYLDEISGCLKTSTTSLKSLSLSLSHEMAQRARKASAAPPPPEEASTDEEDDELLDPHPPPPIHNPVSAAAPATTEADVRKEKQAQETILARVFDMEQHSNESKRLERNLFQKAEQSKAKPEIKVDKIMTDVKSLVEKWKKGDTKGASDDSLTREAIKIVHKATSEYLMNTQSSKSKKVGSKVSTSGNPAAASSLSIPVPAPPMTASSSAPNGSISEPAWPTDPGEEAGTSTVNGHEGSSGQAVESPSWLNASSPENIFSENAPSTLGASSWNSQTSLPPMPFTSQPATPSTLDTPHAISSNAQALSLGFPHTTNGTTGTQTPTSPPQDITLATEQNGSETPLLPVEDGPIKSTLFNKADADENLDVDMIHPDEDPTEVAADQESASEDEEKDVSDVDGTDSPSPRKRVRFEASKKADGTDTDKSYPILTAESIKTNLVKISEQESPEEAMQAWIREKHGYQLEELKLYWIPMRASILSRALDLATLRRITLLNVGSQDGFWMILAGFHSRQGLIALKSIHTDGVSKSFLKFVKSFSGLTELFLHERAKKHETSTTTTPTSPKQTITDIRQQALRKHLKTLQRLMIKNESDSSWDLDAVTVVLLSTKGNNLKELSVSLGMLSFHHLMQNLSSLKNLFAIHLLSIRGALSGGLPYLEYLSSVVDNLSHNPSSWRIRYVAVDNMLCQIHRRSALTIRKFKQARQRRHQLKLSKEMEHAKGKGKETEASETHILSDASSETDFPDDKDLHEMYAMKVKAVVISDLKEVEHIKIFRNELRSGAL